MAKIRMIRVVMVVRHKSDSNLVRAFRNFVDIIAQITFRYVLCKMDKNLESE